VALVYLTAFVQESVHPGSGYLPLFRDYRTGRDWLPSLVHLNQFHESSARILCGYEEDLDLTTGTCGIEYITADSLALWKEGRIPKKWGNYRNNGVFLGWNNEKDSIPGYYRIDLDSTASPELEEFNILTFLAADAQLDPGERKDSTELDPGEKTSNSGEKTSDSEEDDSEDPDPVDFSIVLSDAGGSEYRVRLGDHQLLQPALKPEVYKSRLFWKDPESEVVVQYVAIPLSVFKNKNEQTISAGEIRSICFIFDAEKKGTVLLDQIGFTK